MANSHDTAARIRLSPYLARRSKRVQSLWKTKLRRTSARLYLGNRATIPVGRRSVVSTVFSPTAICLRHAYKSTVKSLNIPVLVAVTICKHEIRQFFHDSLGRGVHEIKRIPVIWLDEFVFRCKSSPMHSLAVVL
jgi:hypothetical protein